MTTEKRALTLEDFWSLKTVNDVQLSPDGRTIAYVVGTLEEKTNKTRSAIWLADLESGEARQFTSGETADTQPRWSPDGRRLAFVSTRHENKQQVFIIDTDGGEPRRLTTAADGAHSPVWSPDSRRICYSASPETDRQKVPQEVAWFEAHPDADQNAPRMRRQNTLVSRMDGRGYIDRRIHLFIADVDDPGAEPRQLTEGEYDDLNPAWSPDGGLIAFVSNRTEQAEHSWVADVWTVAVESGEPICLTNGDLSALLPAWSPDGETIAFYASPDSITDGHYYDVHLWTVSRTGGDQHDLSAPLDRSVFLVLPDYMLPDVAPPAWSPDGQTIYFLAVDHGDSPIFALDRGSGAIRRVSSGAGTVFDAKCTPDGQTLVGVASMPTLPFDVFAVPVAGGELRPVVDTNRELLDAVVTVPPELITFKGPDGWEIEGWLIKPINAGSSRPYPLILHVHGGPQGAFGNAFYVHFQALAGAGYASLYINPRGSTGYGQDFARAADWGEKDYQDLMAGLDAVLERGEVDSERLGVTGLSYGGFMTNWIVGHTDRFAVAVSINGLSNLFSFYGVSDIGALWCGVEFGGPYWASEENWQWYRRHSPITYVERISTPMLLIQSENDYRCPIEQGEQLLNALRARRQVVELVRFPGSSHVIYLSGTPHQRYFERKLAQDWFDAYLKGEKAKTEVREEEAGVTAEPVPVP